jgi:hypothetical protein
MSKNATSTTAGTDWDKIRALSDEEIEAHDVPYDSNDPEAVEEFWKDAVVTHGGGPETVREALAERRRRRGAQMRGGGLKRNSGVIHRQ